MNLFSMALVIVSGMAAVPAAAYAVEPYLPRTTKAFSQIDADSDGKVTLAELQPKAERRMLRFDADGNGEVSSAEIDAVLQKALERRRNQILKRLDTDKSGAISKSELDGFVGELVAGADSDGDGGITLDEARNFKIAKLRKPATGESAN